MPAKKPDAERRDTTLLIRMTAEQHETLKLAAVKVAAEVGLSPSVSAFCTKAALDRAQQILAKK
jgi:uncharacterized protein (DUF1778 family)